MKVLPSGAARAGFAVIVLAVLSGCGGDAGPTDPDGTVDPALAPLLGRWTATTFLVSTETGSDTVDVLATGGSTFTLEIVASGRYTATLTSFGSPNIETGQITVTGPSTLTLRPTDPPGDPDLVMWSITGGTLVLDGPTEFDFNLDGTPEPAVAHIELVRA